MGPTIQMFAFIVSAVCFTNAISTQNPQLTPVLPTKSNVESRTTILNDQQSQQVLITSVSPSHSERTSVKSSTPATPSLLDFNFTPTETVSLEEMFTQIQSVNPTRTTKWSRPSPTSFILKNHGRISSSEIRMSRINNSDLVTTACPKGCQCTQCKDGEVAGHMIHMKCKTYNLKKFLRTFQISRRKVCSLNLAQNKISRIRKNAFKGFINLHSLNLDYNRLEVLSSRMFSGLSSLHYLTITYNNLRTWKGPLWHELPNLKVLNLEGNKNFSSAMTLLKNTTLHSVLGLSFSNSCKNCNMSRENASWSSFLQEEGCDYLPSQYYPMAEELLSTFIIFKGKCEIDNKCQFSLSSTKKLNTLYKNRCWEVVSMMRPVVIVLGALAIAFNTLVVMAIVTTQPLRSVTTLLLISHMSFCDILIGVYAVAVGDGHGLVAKSSSQFRKWRLNSCPYFRTFFVYGQIMEVATSLLVTTERYFAVVFCMNPSIRIKKKNAALLLLLFWIVASIFVYLQHVYDAATITDNYMCIIVRNVNNHEDRDVFYSQVVMLLLVAIYLVTMFQYCHIYFFVRRSSVNAGVRRETKLASRICIMVFTSFAFFAVPNLIMIITTIGDVGFPLTAVQNNLLKMWLPPMFLVFNACINPMLFAYRNDKFVNSLKNRVKALLKIRFLNLNGISRLGREENSQIQLNTMKMRVLASPRTFLRLSPRSKHCAYGSGEGDPNEGDPNPAYTIDHD